MLSDSTLCFETFLPGIKRSIKLKYGIDIDRMNLEELTYLSEMVECCVQDRKRNEEYKQALEIEEKNAIDIDSFPLN